MQNVRPLALTAQQASALADGARRVYDRALEEITRGLAEADAAAIRYEFALRMYRVAVGEMGEEPDDFEDEPTSPGVLCGCGEDDCPGCYPP